MINTQFIDVDTLINSGLANYLIIDVRSPAEYATDHIPTAVNLPLLDNEERKIVGIIYKENGPKSARLKGVELISPKLPDLINNINTLKDGRLIIFYCWRGGLRSEAMSSFAKLAGIYTKRVEGGYKSFRKMIVSFFDQFNEKRKYEDMNKCTTIYGPTGCGKTKILEILSKNVPVVNLEKNAAHKGSSFGMIDEPGFERVTQKNFESAVWYDFYNNKFNNRFLIEGESRKIGKVVVPAQLFNYMKKSINVLVDMPLDTRIDFTIKNYKPDFFVEEIRGALYNLKRLLGTSKVKDLSDLLDKKDFRTFTKTLLLEYYDPLYKNSMPDKIDHYIKYNDISEGSKKLYDLYEA